MMRFLKTNQVGNTKASHHHTVYLNDEANTAVLSTDAKHTHTAQWIPPVPPTPPTPPSQDPMTGQMIPGNPGSPGQPGYWQIGPGGKDGHTHEFEVYEEKEKKPKTKDNETTVGEVQKIFRDLKEYEKDSFKKGEESYGFYTGKQQWSDGDRRALEAQSRACLTINKVAQKIDTLLSYQIEQRADPKLRPQEGGDQRVGELGEIVTKNIFYQCGYVEEETRAFKDAAVPGRGILGIRFDTTRSIRGDIIVERIKWSDILYGPHEREDAEDAEVVCFSKWYSKEKLKADYPEKAEDIQRDWEAMSSLTTDHVTISGDQYKSGTAISLSNDFVNVGSKEYRVIECWRKVWKEGVAAVVPNDEYAVSVVNWEKEDIDSLATIPGVKIIKKPVCRVRCTTVAGATLLTDEDPIELPPVEGRQDYFPFIPIYCYKDGKDFWGKVEIAKDPQREINKRHSQAVDIVNKVATYGHFYDDMTFPDEAAKKHWIEHSATPGFNQRVSSTDRPPKQVDGVKFPGELVQLMQLDDQALDQMMNIVAQPYGANESGAALVQKQRLKLAGNEFLFENLRNARAKLVKLTLGYTQKHYTLGRVYRLIQNSSDKDKARIGGRPAAEYTEEEIASLLTNQDLTKLDLVVDEAQWSPTIRLANSAIMMELAKTGQIPPEIPIELNDSIPRAIKDKIMEMIKQRNEAQANAEQAKQQTEIQKTLLAKGINPNEVAQGQGAPAPQVQQPAPPQMPEMEMQEVSPDMGMSMPEPGAPCPVCGEITPSAPMIPQVMPMAPSVVPSQPANINVSFNVNVNDKGKRAISLGPIAADGSRSGAIDPLPDIEDGTLSPEQLAPIVQELNSL
jgi:hypothetical protein